MTRHALEEILLFIALAVGSFVAIMAPMLLALYMGMRSTNERNNDDQGAL